MTRNRNRNRIPARPDIGHLKRQAKELLAAYRHNDPDALQRFRDALPAAAGQDDTFITAMGLRLHDAQSCIAREYGFASWADLAAFVQARRAQLDDPAKALLHWLRLVYAGDLAGGNHLPRPATALQLWHDDPAMLGEEPYLACAVGNEAVLRAATQRDPSWLHRAGGPLQVLPLVAVTHSALVSQPETRERLLGCARFLLEAGASPDQSAGSRWPPASLQAPSETDLLSALYGAAGRNHDPELTRLLLNAGANPNDGESLYHSLEQPECTRLLLEAGARIVGTNAMYRVLDLDNLQALALLLAHGGDANEPPLGPPTSEWGSPLLWAIRRRRSVAHVRALLDAGADPHAVTVDGLSALTMAQRHGLTQVADLLAEVMGVNGQAVTASDAFVAACARGDAVEARAMQSRHPRIIESLDARQRALLPELAAEGCDAAVRLMVTLGWPIEVRGGDIDGSALNHAVFRGDAALTRYLLEQGADWTALHGFDDNACGSLSWASLNTPVAGGDWVGCAQALLDHGMPTGRPDPQATDNVVLIGTRRYAFSDDVVDCLLQVA